MELGGFDTDREFTGINGGKTITTGFGHNTVLSANVVDFLVKNFEIHPTTTPEQYLAEILK